MIGCIFCINLFIGVMFSFFEIEQQNANDGDINRVEEKWLEIQQLILKKKPNSFKPPIDGLKKILYDIFKCNFYHIFMNFCMILNLIILITDFKSQKNILIFLTIIYFSETAIKLYTFGLNCYFSFHNHSIEFLISIAYILLIFENQIFYILNLPPKIKRLIALIKLSVLLRFLKNIKTLQKMIRTLTFSFKLILNMAALVLINFLVYSTIGCFMFRKVKRGKTIDEYVNFKNLFYGMMTLFKCSTGDGWAHIMLDTYKTSPNCEENVDCGSSNIFFNFFKIFIVKFPLL